jgi:hypothetical protein
MLVGIPWILTFIFVILSFFLSPFILAISVIVFQRKHILRLRTKLILVIIGCLEVAYSIFYLFAAASNGMDTVPVLFALVFPMLTLLIGFTYLLKHTNTNIHSTNWYSGKRKWLLLGTALALSTVMLTVLAFQVSVYSHMYPQDLYNGKANLAVKGVVTSIQDNYKVDGMVMGSYHIFHSYIGFNVTEILWVDSYLVETNVPVYEIGSTSVTYGSVYDLKFVGIGYDNFDKPHLSVGQTIECKGDYDPATDSPYSFKITISPSINGSYLIIA